MRASVSVTASESGCRCVRCACSRVNRAQASASPSVASTIGRLRMAAPLPALSAAASALSFAPNTPGPADFGGGRRIAEWTENTRRRTGPCRLPLHRQPTR